MDCQPYFPFEVLQGRQQFTIANTPTTLIVFRFYKGALYDIIGTFKQTDFERVSSAFVEKYGKPNSDITQSYQNRFGATFTGRIMGWKNLVSSIQLSERTSDLDVSGVAFTHDDLHKQAEAAEPKSSPDL